MKRLLVIPFLIFVTLFAQVTLAAIYTSIILDNGEYLSGELIETYEDRWFYEDDSEKVEKFILVFTEESEGPQFIFKNVKEIRLQFSFETKTSDYKNYLIANNIIFQNDVVKDSSVLTGHEGHHKFERMFGNFAWDLGVLDEAGKQFQNSGEQLDDYFIFNKEVISPVIATVVGKVNDQIDNKPDLDFTSDLSDKINNYLTLHIKDQIYLSLVHFKQDSIEVNVGDIVVPGQRLGTVGNSGVSYIPHLHYTLYLYLPKFDRFISIPGFSKTNRTGLAKPVSHADHLR